MSSSRKMSEDHEEEEDMGLEDPNVVTKYKEASAMANTALQAVVAACAAGASVSDLCKLGDSSIATQTGSVYNKPVNGKKVEKGVAFPTCVSVNNCVGHNSPLVSAEPQLLADGDVVKIDLGVHLGGYVAVVAHTTIVAAAGATITGRKADVVCAAHMASEAVIRMLAAGTKNKEISEVITKCAEAYGCNAVEGVLSQDMKKFVIAGKKVIMNKPTVEQKTEECTVEEGDVFAIDIVMSSGTGKPREEEARTTVFKRNGDNKYSLKMKTSRATLAEISEKFNVLPFTLRAMEDENKGRMGIVECLKHDLVTPYPVLWERQGEFVAQFKFTCLVLKNGQIRTTQGPEFAFKVSSEHEIKDEAVKAILARELKVPVKKNKKNKKKTAGGASADAMDTS